MNMTSYLSGNDFILGLEENAIDSLVHAVEHFIYGEKDTDLKYTILHVFHATELFLKARLAKADPELIYNKKLRKDGTRGTVGLDELKNLLNKKGVVLPEQDNKNLDFLREVRNSIEHYRVACNREEIEEYVGRAMYFLDKFLQKELEINLKEQLDKIDDEAYQTLAKACVFYIKRMQEQGISLHPKDKVYYNFFLCEVCEEETVVFPDHDSDDNTIHCFCCQSRYSVKYCLKCDCPIPSLIGSGETIAQNIGEDFDDDFGEDDRVGFCDVCQEWVDQQD